jgi:DNA-binding XRE family transcriptional regulator
MTYTKQRPVSIMTGMGRKRIGAKKVYMTATQLRAARTDHFQTTQPEMAKLLGMALRTYKSYESESPTGHEIPETVALLVRCLKNAK